MVFVDVLARLDFERNSKGSPIMSISNSDLNGGINVAFKAVHGRPDMLLDVQELADTHGALLVISAIHESIRSWIRRNEFFSPTSQFRHLRQKVLSSISKADLDGVQVFNVLLHRSFDHIAEEQWAPVVGHKCFLEDLVEQSAVD